MLTVEEIKDLTVRIMEGWIMAHSSNWDAWGASDAREWLQQNAGSDKHWTFQENIDARDKAAQAILDRYIRPMVCKHHGICTEWGCEYCEEDDTRELDENEDWGMLKEYVSDGYYFLTDDECEKLSIDLIKEWHEMIGLENIVEECQQVIDEIRYSQGKDLLLALTKASHVVHYNGRMLEDYNEGIDEIYLLATEGLDVACGRENINKYLEEYSGL